MSNILIVLPYSGRSFGGGLAVFNQEFTKALVANGHSVKLLTLDVRVPSGRAPINPTAEDHGRATILYINDEPILMQNPGGIDKEREELYERINDPDYLARNDVQAKVLGSGAPWHPEIIIGHSRFSGAAAILLKNRYFHDAKTSYFLHSYPVEGTVLTGYDAYGEAIDTESAERKIALEAEWMKRADLVVPVGPLLRAGALKLLNGAKVRIHECIGGVEATERVRFREPRGPIRLLFNGRATAPIKGLEDILLAAQILRDDGDCPPLELHVRYWADRNFYPGGPIHPSTEVRTVDYQAAQKFADEIVNVGSHAGKVTVLVGPSTTTIMDEVRASYGVLMPSYIEHFGLVPMEALSAGVPVLVNEISGAGMFLARLARTQAECLEKCVVHDFYKRVSASEPDDFLEPRLVPTTAFDGRPAAWAKAIKELATDLPIRFKDAGELGDELSRYYSWQDCAKAFHRACGVSYEECAVTFQIRGGNLERG
ncbi:glycosyltransferase [Rhodanobacter sp. A1T4]|uniref:glycosyltransferase n=1 Tax=Rhodanobacter sp. A1T4 TaxID=2723087 RepID=UPI0016199A97|nr:glycosyltransferase [Rhodanobacter sp. A1T4]MBB6248714.1 glycosyltransferase involved in cell wall biosynthesis [Rhodanobacter sp. A1T4]